MPGNSFGKIFSVTTWGESHGAAVGCLIDGCPPGLFLNNEIVQEMMDKRKPGKSIASTSRKESDKAKILSGTFKGLTTGTPIMILIENKDADSKAYDDIKKIYRPGHGDITYDFKYGIRDFRGGGRASARETAARVAAGAVAKLLLDKKNDKENDKKSIEVKAYTIELGGIKADIKNYDFSILNKNMFLCPDSDAAFKMEELVKKIKKEKDSIGGVVEIRVKNPPKGLGEPVFDKLDADIAKAMMSIGAVKGVEIGAGFDASSVKGSKNNDPITKKGFLTNNSGGILAGISNGDDIIARVAVKPIPSIGIKQNTIDKNGNKKSLEIKGRHDVCAIPRINVVCEAMMNIVLADHLLRQRTLK
jgi:chorismate synthase